MPNGDEPADVLPGLRIVVELDGYAVMYWVGSPGLSPPDGGAASAATFYLNAGRLLSDLRDLNAEDSPTEGALIDRVSRIGLMVAAEPSLEAAIGFHVGNGETGLITMAYVGQPPGLDEPD